MTFRKKQHMGKRSIEALQFRRHQNSVTASSLGKPRIQTYNLLQLKYFLKYRYFEEEATKFGINSQSCDNYWYKNIA